MSGGKRRFDDALQDDGSGGGRRFDAALSEGDQPTYGYDSQDQGALTLPDLPTGPPSTALDTAKDAVTGLAEGAYRGVGIDPAQLFGDRAAMQMQAAHSASPTASRIGEFGGEAGIQTLGGRALSPLLKGAKVAPAAAGALSGLLSGVGNSSGSATDRARAGLGGAAAGAVLAPVIGGATGKLSSLLENKAPQLAENQATHGLMNRGAQPSDLARLDELGGRQQFYDDANRLGIKGKPAEAAPVARQVANDAEATRAAIEARNAGVQVDPNAAAAAVRGANPYPGVQRMDRAADRAANQVQQAGPGLGAMDTQRAYYGNSQNFASGTPNAQLGKGIHGAINNEMEDAMNLANPGDGSAWRQAGRDERTGIELGGFAQKAADTQRAAPWTPGEVATGGLSRLINNNRHAIAETGYGAAAGMANGGAKLGSLLQGAPAAFSGDVGGKYSSENSKPLRVDQAALDLLGGGSKGAELGQWRDQIAQAAGSPDTGAVQATITRLTMSDPEFRIKILPLLRQQAGGQM